MLTYKIVNEFCVLRNDGASQVSISTFDSPQWPNTNPDYLAYRQWLADGGVPLPADPPPAAELRAQLLATLTGEYEQRMQVIAAGYPPSERESWPVQTQEARDLLVYPEAETPWIDAACAARGIDRLELASRIVAKDAAYRAVHGQMTGVRQRVEDEIDAAGDDAHALQAIDVSAAWPTL